MSETKSNIFHGMQILIDRAWKKNQAVVVEGDKIKAIIAENMIEHHLPAKLHKYHPDHYLIPGLIDLHIHGAAGLDVMDASQKALHGISAALAKEGVTGYLATTMTADPSQIDEVLKNIAEFMKQSHCGILGVHLEGPFLSKEKIGAQNIQYARLPAFDLVKRWQQIAKGAIKILTLAPELEGAIELIRHMDGMDIIAAIGHTNATYAETQAAINAGAAYATHLFNAMRMVTQREPGAVGALLLDNRVKAELIVDNYHLHAVMIELALRIKGADHLVLVSDAMRAKCLGDGQYDLGGLTVTVQDGKATLANGRLAGSTLRLPQAIKNMSAFKYCGLIEAIIMATSNPAYIIGCADRKGSIEVGKDADLVVLDQDLNAVFTMRGGEEVFN